MKHRTYRSNWSASPPASAGASRSKTLPRRRKSSQAGPSCSTCFPPFSKKKTPSSTRVKRATAGSFEVSSGAKPGGLVRTRFDRVGGDHLTLGPLSLVKLEQKRSFAT